MVKVVGKDESAVHRITCRSCASVLEYTQSEVKYIKHSHDYLGDYEVDQGIKCPQCGSNVFTDRRR
jgi:DNA-directed RNA polymerase subunit RPC12/RpoP